jgi:hypothetical protein
VLPLWMDAAVQHLPHGSRQRKRQQGWRTPRACRNRACPGARISSSTFPQRSRGIKHIWQRKFFGIESFFWRDKCEQRKQHAQHRLRNRGTANGHMCVVVTTSLHHVAVLQARYAESAGCRPAALEVSSRPPGAQIAAQQQLAPTGHRVLSSP